MELEQLQAPSTYAPIHAVNLDDVPVVCNDRHISLKEQAALCRKLFRDLGVKGMSVTTPQYSMAQSVDVRLPNEPAPDMTGYEEYEHSTYSEMPEDVPAKAAQVRRQAARLKVMEILDRAFPAHNDRSDYQSDYFDYRWSVD